MELKQVNFYWDDVVEELVVSCVFEINGMCYPYKLIGDEEGEMVLDIFEDFYEEICEIIGVPETNDLLGDMVCDMSYLYRKNLAKTSRIFTDCPDNVHDIKDILREAFPYATVNHY